MTEQLKTDPSPLPGLSAATRGLRSVRWIGLASGCVVPIALESFLPARFVVPWAIAWLCVAFCLLGLFFRDTRNSRRAEREEISRGYTTAPTVANENPDLFLLDRRTFQTLAGPGELRPANIRKQETARAIARRAAKGTGSS